MPMFTGYDDSQIVGQNPDGSPIVIARNGLSPDYQNNLISQIPPPDNTMPTSPQQATPPTPAPSAATSLKSVLWGSAASDAADKYAKMKALTDPGMSPAIKNHILDQMEAEDNAKKASQAISDKEAQKYNDRAQALGLPTAPVSGSASSDSAAPQADAQSSLPETSKASMDTPPAGTPSTPSSTDNSFINKGLAGLQKGADEQRAGIQQEADVAAQKGKQEAAEYGNLQTKLAPLDQQRQTQIQQNQADLHSQLDSYKAAVDQYNNTPSADPNRIWKNASTPSKITALFSIMLGGYAGGVSGRGGNVGMDEINKQVDRDLEAQKMDLEKKKGNMDSRSNLLGQMRNVYNDDNQAYAAARGIMLENTKLQLQKISSQLAPGEAQAKANQAKGVLDQNIQTNQLNFLKSGAEAIKASMGPVSTEDQIKNGLQAQNAAIANKNLEDAQSQNKSYIGTLYDKTLGKIGPLRFSSREDADQSKSMFYSALNGGKPASPEQEKEFDQIYMPSQSDGQDTRDKKAAARVQAIRQLQLQSQPMVRGVGPAPQVVVDPKTGRSVIMKPKNPQMVAKGQ